MVKVVSRTPTTMASSPASSHSSLLRLRDEGSASSSDEGQSVFSEFPDSTSFSSEIGSVDYDSDMYVDAPPRRIRRRNTESESGKIEMERDILRIDIVEARAVGLIVSFVSIDSVLTSNLQHIRRLQLALEQAVGVLQFVMVCAR